MNTFFTNNFADQMGRWRHMLLTVIGVIALAGCKAAAPPAQAPPPTPVTVAHPVQKEVIEWDIYTGHLKAIESVNVVARVSGLVMETPFTEGSIVKKGDLLVVIDERPFKADLDAKLADQQKTEAQLAILKLTYNRILAVLNKAATQQEVDEAKANVDQAIASVASAKAAVETARLNLQWCRVLSPIDGRVSNKQVTVGNFVNGGAGPVTTILTTIQSVSPMYCYVDIDEHSVLKYQKLATDGKLASARGGKVPCFVQIGNETNFPHDGVIDFVDNQVDPATGTQQVRGILNNKDGVLTPGFFARMRIPGTGRYQTLLVPDVAIGYDQDERSLLVLDADNKVVPVRVKVGALFGDLRSITSGLKPDDRVIVNGIMHVRPGMIVAPTEGPIKVDEAAFWDPGPSVATRPGDSDVAMGSSSTVIAATTQPAAGIK